MAEKQFTEGLWFNAPREGAPEFVIGSLSISPKKFVQWLGQQKEDEKGYVRVDILRSREGKPYCQLDTFEKKAPTGVEVDKKIRDDYPKEKIDPNDIPF